MRLFRCRTAYIMNMVAVLGFTLWLACGGAAGAAQAVYYEPDIRDIIRKDCTRCHSGSLRNLMSWDSVRMYVDNGMLSAMIQGPMAQFAGPADADTILSWIDAGAPENPPRKRTDAKPVAFTSPGQGVYYEPDIRDIIRKDCARCHSGTLRNLMSWDSVRMYVDNGMLSAMIQGPMRQFSGPADANTIQAWIDAGAPENQPRKKTEAKPAAFAASGQVVAAAPSQASLTYTRDIQGLLAKDCLRCHQGPFRSLTTFEQVRTYANSGLLASMVQPGGLMNRFVGTDAQMVLTWIRAGAPR